MRSRPTRIKQFDLSASCPSKVELPLSTALGMTCLLAAS